MKRGVCGQRTGKERPGSPGGLPEWDGRARFARVLPHGTQPARPQGPQGNSHDPAGSTQMFRAFVDEGAPQRQPQAAGRSAGPRVGLIVGLVVAAAVVAAVAWLALG